MAALFRDHQMDQLLQKTGYVRSARQAIQEDLEQFFREPMETIARRYWGSAKAPENLTPEQLQNYYAKSDRYVYESTYTEAYLDHQRLLRLILRLSRKHGKTPVLDFGGGGGGIALALARAGIEAEYADIPGKLTQFAQWRFFKHRVQVPIQDVFGPLPRHRYGMILAIDVLEHLPDLSGCVKKLYDGLNSGGSLVVTQSFSPEDPLHIPAWFKYNDLKLFNQFMKEHHFIYQGRIKPDPISAWIHKIIHQPVILHAYLSRKVKGGGNLLLYKKA